MAITPLDRIVSLGNDGVYTSTISASDAIDKLIANDGTFAAVEVTNTFPYWPRLDNFLNDDNPSLEFTTTTNPRYIWDKPQAQPDDTVYFAVGSKPFSATSPLDFSVYITAVADNAFEITPHIDLIIFLNNTWSIDNDFLKVTLQDGPLIQPSPEAGPPFGWQTVRYYSNSYSTNLAVGENLYRLVFVFKAVNYPTPVDFNKNPGGLAFNIDIYRQT